jgi:hypothetical protein
LRRADQPIRAGESIRVLRLMSKVRQTAAFVAPMSSAATTTSFLGIGIDRDRASLCRPRRRAGRGRQ